MNIRTCLLVVLIATAVAAPLPAQSTIVVVRHAEKVSDGNDPDLSEVGRARANALAATLRDAGINALFTTEYKRTQQTAAPTAEAAHVTPTVIPAKDVPALSSKLRELRGNALVVGHSNTIPRLLNELGVDLPLSLGEYDYDDLFVVTGEQNRQLLRLHYPQGQR